jgi:hypothetical protein
MNSESATPEEASDAQDAQEDDVWVELKRGSEGVSLSVYESVDGETNVIDEAWWTWAGFADVDPEDLPDGISETTKLDASPN